MEGPGRVESPNGVLEDAWRVVEEGVRTGAYTGAVALVATRERVLLHRATGWACLDPPRPMTPSTVFDLASLTKVVATLPVVLWLVARGALVLDQPLGTVLAEFASRPWERLTLRHLLTHTSGLPAWLPLYLSAHGPEAYRAAIAAVQPVAPPGQTVVYSDLNFILLGEVVRQLTGRDIADLAEQVVFRPVGMRDTCFCPPEAWRERTAATERGNVYEMRLAGSAGKQFPHWRRDLIWGAVHDGNAFYGLDGIAGHAGLFATAADLARYGQWWLQQGVWHGRTLLPPELIAAATTMQAPGRGLGWVVAGPLAQTETFSGRGLSPRAFGHTGFTGTSLWIDPERDLVAVLLTNRVHPVVRDGITSVRAAFHECVAAAFPWRDETVDGVPGAL